MKAPASSRGGGASVSPSSARASGFNASSDAANRPRPWARTRLIGPRAKYRSTSATVPDRTKATASRQADSVSKCCPSGLVTMTTIQPQSSGRLCTARSACTASFPIALTSDDALSRTCAPRLSGAKGSVTPSTMVLVSGTAAASAGAETGLPLTIASSVAVNAARFAGSFKVSSAARA